MKSSLITTLFTLTLTSLLSTTTSFTFIPTPLAPTPTFHSHSTPSSSSTSLSASAPNPDLENRIKTIIATQLNILPTQLQTETKFQEDLGADSLDTVELIMALETEFEVEIAEETAKGMTTYGAVVDYLASL